MKKIVLILAGFVAGVLFVFLLAPTITGFSIFSGNSEEERLIKEYYETEVAVHVSPHSLRKAMDKGDSSFILVDLRSEEEYNRGHILGAINIPAYKTPDKSAYEDVERIVGTFAKLPKDKEIIVYCYSIPCMTGRKIGYMLAEHNIYVKQLGIGWNEWRYYWNLWNHEHEWVDTDVKEYIESNITTQLEPLPHSCASGEFSC